MKRFNPDHQMFGHDRLAEDTGRARHRRRERPPARTCCDAVKSFAVGASQSDDITIVLLKWDGAPSIAGGDAAEAPRARVGSPRGRLSWTPCSSGSSTGRGSTRTRLPELVSDLRLVAEEVFLNIVSYSGLSEQDCVQVVFRPRCISWPSMEFVDRGRPWNPPRAGAGSDARAVDRRREHRRSRCVPRARAHR